MKKIENDNIIINYSDSLEKLANGTIVLLKNKISEYKKLFNASNIENVTVNYFDNLEEFREFIYKLRGERESLPEYARGTYDKGMINVCVDPNKQMNRLYTASHELFHILYMDYILKGNFSNRIVWYDEGMAQFYSGEKRKIESYNDFKKYYLKVKENTKLIPNLNDLEHGDSFCNNQYNGYDLSYLSIRYLFETINEKDFEKLMSNFDKIKNMGKTILKDMFQYYDKKLNIKKVE